jgi:two-component system, sensor histidine kinase and response regulator
MSNDVGLPTVLVIEDDQGCVELITEVLSELGLPIFVCDRVEEALVAIVSMPLRLVILDVMLPDGDGFTVLAAIRLNPATRNVPILLCTAALFEVTAYQKPIDDPLTEIVAKPFHIDNFLQVVSTMIGSN